MQKNDNITLKRLSVIRYKKKKQVREFYIPEVNGDGRKTHQKDYIEANQVKK